MTRNGKIALEFFLKMQTNKLINVSELIPKNHNFPYSWIGHVFFAHELVSEIRPKIIVELGTHTGNSYFSFCQAVKKNKLNTKCFAVDTWKGDKHASYYGKSVYKKVSKINDNYLNFSTLLKKTFDEAIDDFKDQSIDLLHIDGLHTYEAVSHDFYSWLPKLKKNAIVLFHDTNVKHSDFGVHIFWSEMKKKYKFTYEFFHSNGLGILQLGKKADDKILSIFKMKKKLLTEVSASYEFLGSLYYESFNNKYKIIHLNEKFNEIIKKNMIEKKSIESKNRDLKNELKKINNTKTMRYTKFLRGLFKMKLNFLKKYIKI